MTWNLDKMYSRSTYLKIKKKFLEKCQYNAIISQHKSEIKKRIPVPSWLPCDKFIFSLPYASLVILHLPFPWKVNEIYLGIYLICMLYVHWTVCLIFVPPTERSRFIFCKNIYHCSVAFSFFVLSTLWCLIKGGKCRWTILVHLHTTNEIIMFSSV